MRKCETRIKSRTIEMPHLLTTYGSVYGSSPEKKRNRRRESYSSAAETPSWYVPRQGAATVGYACGDVGETRQRQAAMTMQNLETAHGADYESFIDLVSEHHFPSGSR